MRHCGRRKQPTRVSRTPPSLEAATAVTKLRPSASAAPPSPQAPAPAGRSGNGWSSLTWSRDDQLGRGCDLGRDDRGDHAYPGYVITVSCEACGWVAVTSQPV